MIFYKKQINITLGDPVPVHQNSVYIYSQEQRLVLGSCGVTRGVLDRSGVPVGHFLKKSIVLFGPLPTADRAYLDSK